MIEDAIRLVNVLVLPDWKSDYKVRASRFRKTSDRETGSIYLSLTYESVAFGCNDPVEGDRLRRDQFPSLPDVPVSG